MLTAEQASELNNALNSFAVDLTAQALQGRLPVAYERNPQVGEVLRALAAPGYLYPMLIGGPRGGKTAVAYHAVNCIARGECPESLRGARVYEITPSRILGVFGGREHVAGRLGEFLPVLAASNAILFVRDLHTALGMGTPSGETAPDLAQILSDLLQGVHPRVLFEARRLPMEAMFTERPGLKGQFSLIAVEAMPRNGALAVVRRSAEDLEIVHEVTIRPDAVEEAVDLATRFQVNEQLPGPAVDLLKDVLATCDPAGTPEIGRETVRRRFLQRSGLPEFLISDDAPYDEAASRACLAQRVFGQEPAVEAILRMIALVRARLNNPLRPMGVFLFLGPTGVGKTELVKALAQYLFSGQERIVRFNMADYAESWTVPVLFGNPYGDNEAERVGHLAMRLAGHNFAVLLLDEFEKANPQVNQRFLQLFDEGLLINGQGDELNLRNTVIVLTSNLGARLADSRIGFKVGDPAEEAEKAVLHESQAYFRPEFINRLDAVCLFKPLTRQVTRQIAQREIAEVIGREGIARQKLRIDVDDSAVDLMVERGYDLQFGARYLKRQIERSITYPLARQIARKRLQPGASVRLFARRGEVYVGLLDEGEEREAGDAAQAAGPEQPATDAQPLSARVLRTRLEAAGARIARLAGQHRVDEMKQRIAAMMEHVGDPDFWQDARAAEARIEAMNALSQRVDQLETARRLCEQCAEALNRIPAGTRSKGDDPALEEANRLFRALTRELPLAELMLCLRAPEDQGGAFLTVRAAADDVGKGQAPGLACQWARDLASMYAQWAESRGYAATLVNETAAPDAAPDGVREATFHIDGFGAYALLKGETGSHRLTRAAPGGRNGERATVWARVEVLPSPAVAAQAARDLRIDSRAVREPGVLAGRVTRMVTIARSGGDATGRVVVWRNALAAEEVEQLAPRYLAALARSTPAETPDAADGLVSISDQVRAYNLFKQPSVKDQRTRHTSTQPRKVLAGELDEFLLAYLEMSVA